MEKKKHNCFIKLKSNTTISELSEEINSNENYILNLEEVLPKFQERFINIAEEIEKFREIQENPIQLNESDVERFIENIENLNNDVKKAYREFLFQYENPINLPKNSILSRYLQNSSNENNFSNGKYIDDFENLMKKIKNLKLPLKKNYEEINEKKFQKLIEDNSNEFILNVLKEIEKCKESLKEITEKEDRSYKKDMEEDKEIFKKIKELNKNNEMQQNFEKIEQILLDKEKALIYARKFRNLLEIKYEKKINKKKEILLWATDDIKSCNNMTKIYQKTLKVMISLEEKKNLQNYLYKEYDILYEKIEGFLDRNISIMPVEIKAILEKKKIFKTLVQNNKIKKELYNQYDIAKKNLLKLLMNEYLNKEKNDGKTLYAHKKAIIEKKKQAWHYSNTLPPQVHQAQNKNIDKRKKLIEELLSLDKKKIENFFNNKKKDEINILDSTQIIYLNNFLDQIIKNQETDENIISKKFYLLNFRRTNDYNYHWKYSWNDFFRYFKRKIDDIRDY